MLGLFGVTKPRIPRLQAQRGERAGSGALPRLSTCGFARGSPATHDCVKNEGVSSRFLAGVAGPFFWDVQEAILRLFSVKEPRIPRLHAQRSERAGFGALARLSTCGIARGSPATHDCARDGGGSSQFLAGATGSFLGDVWEKR